MLNRECYKAKVVSFSPARTCCRGHAVLKTVESCYLGAEAGCTLMLHARASQKMRLSTPQLVADGICQDRLSSYDRDCGLPWKIQASKRPVASEDAAPAAGVSAGFCMRAFTAPTKSSSVMGLQATAARATSSATCPV